MPEGSLRSLNDGEPKHVHRHLHRIIRSNREKINPHNYDGGRGDQLAGRACSTQAGVFSVLFDWQWSPACFTSTVEGLQFCEFNEFTGLKALTKEIIDLINNFSSHQYVFCLFVVFTNTQYRSKSTWTLNSIPIVNAKWQSWFTQLVCETERRFWIVIVVGNIHFLRVF